MPKTTRYPRLARAIFIAAALCGILGLIQAEGFFVLAAFLGLVAIIFRSGVGKNLDNSRPESALSFGYRAQFRRSPRNR